MMIATALTLFLLIQQPMPVLSLDEAERSADSIKTLSVETFFTPSNDMKAFLDQHVMRRATDMDKLKALVYAIFDEERLGMKYSNHETLTPNETFDHHTGNCLSFTGMFIAMARHCGLNVRFQEVSDVSTWSQNGKFMIFNQHMNAVVSINGRQLEVDFNYHIDKDFKITRFVSDERALAHYYNNLGAEHLAREDFLRAQIYFEKANQTDPTFTQAWTNYGVLQRIKGNYKEAEACYIRAQSLDKHNDTAKMNLALLYELQGKIRKAEHMKQQIRKFRARNPYFQYSLGNTAYKEGRYEEAVSRFKKAVRLFRNHPKFLVMLAASYQKVGKYKKAEKFLRKARKLAGKPEEKHLYDMKIKSLYANR
ncbi:MAG: hypothetical protein CR997_08800 [Acidobacteria bacterium]|nr:MAG: hypothetical protein CR997_08800 [Acidobacteriota bacterium]